MDSSIIDPVVANTKAPPSEMAVLSSSETEASPVAAAERIHNETSSSFDRGDNVSHQPMISMPQNDDYCQDKSPEIGTQDHHRQTQSLARGGTFVTPKRLKINNVVLPNKHLAHDKTKESYHNFPMGPPGNAVTPASIRGGSTPGTLATSPDSISDGMACGKENEDARGAVSTPAVGNKGTDAHTGLTETETIFNSINSDAGSDVKMEPSTQSTPMQMKMDPSMSLASSSVKAINLGPRMNPPRQSTPAKAIPLMPRKQSPQRAPQHQTTSPVVPRRLDSVMANKGLEQSGGTIDAPSALSEVASAATSLAVRSDSRDESSPSMEDIPPPSHFLAAKISPLRSSSRLKKSESKIRERDLTPPPSSTSSKYEVSVWNFRPCISYYLE